MSVRRIPNEKLFVSEPNPLWFGNVANEPNEGWTNSNWLKSRFHFSFAEYDSEANQNFGVIRVLNDDLVQPLRGFGQHPHENMEIVTYVVSGELTHEDSKGNRESLNPGSVQFMTSGTGIQHSEHNLIPNEPLRFIQTWILPRTRNLAPNYGSVKATPQTARRSRNKWSHLCSDILGAASTPVKINQDCNMYASVLDVAAVVEMPIGPKRQAYVICIEGSCLVNDSIELFAHDALEVVGEITVKFSAETELGHLLMFEMAYDPKGHGREDL
eukprot:c13549_g1_i1.p1 GENE.c13549_g1_i1~~c13549_g1_i1.p1  ORF type:complete len:271 (+),score=44.37 c13549_g1_i1:40-852(+)